VTVIAYAATLAALLVGFILGYGARPFLCRFLPLKPVEPQQLSAYMDKIVNQEEAEVRRNEVRRMLHDAGRRTMRLDGGPPAKVHKMRRKRRMYRDPTA
jgi:hypothetical protein